MARYTCNYVVHLPFEEVKGSLSGILQGCQFDIMHDTKDFLLAREKPGNVPFAKLVTIEALFDRPVGESAVLKVDLVVKNEELPLKLHNHCQQRFVLVRDAIAENQSWELLSTED